MERDEHPHIPLPTTAGLGEELHWLTGMQRGLGMEDGGAGAIPLPASGFSACPGTSP